MDAFDKECPRCRKMNSPGSRSSAIVPHGVGQAICPNCNSSGIEHGSLLSQRYRMEIEADAALLIAANPIQKPQPPNLSGSPRPMFPELGALYKGYTACLGCLFIPWAFVMFFQIAFKSPVSALFFLFTVAVGLYCIPAFNRYQTNQQHEKALGQYKAESEKWEKQEEHRRKQIRSSLVSVFYCRSCNTIFNVQTGASAYAPNLNKRMGEAAVAELYQLQLQAILAGQLPTISVNINLKIGEICHFAALATISEERVLRREYQGNSQGLSFRVTRGVSYRIGQSRGRSVSIRGVTQIASGSFYITSQRCIFNGHTHSFAFQHSKLLSFDQYEDGLQLHMENRQKTQIIGFHNSNDAELAALVLSGIMQ